MDLPWSHHPTAEAPVSQLELTDGELLRQAKQGDPQAFAVLYRRYLGRVYDYTVIRLGSREAAEDATQAIFVRALAGLRTCRDDTMFAGWLFAIARNAVIDLHRTRRVTLPLDGALEIASDELAPEEHAIRTDERDRLRALSARCLTEREREILALRLQELTDREIATALRCSHGAVRTAQYRLVQKLRRCPGDPELQGGHRHAGD